MTLGIKGLNGVACINGYAVYELETRGRDSVTEHGWRETQFVLFTRSLWP